MKHKHCDCIVAWANGETIQVATIGKEDWTDIEVPTWSLHFEYRIKPAAPKWPETTMSHDELGKAYNDSVHNGGTRGIANAALRHACETGQLVLPDPDRDMKIAQAVKDAAINAFCKATPHMEIETMYRIDLESIIKEATK